MASRGGTPATANHEREVDEPPERNDAPLTIRLEEPGGSATRRDVRLRVDYFSGRTVEARARQVASCLFGTAEGRSLSSGDKRLLLEQLCYWLSKNNDALRRGHTIALGLTDDTSELVFSFKQSDPCVPVGPPEVDAPPARPPLPEAEPPLPPPPPVAGPSVASRRPRRPR